MFNKLQYINCGRSLSCHLEESGFIKAAAVMLSSPEKICQGKLKVRRETENESIYGLIWLRKNLYRQSGQLQVCFGQKNNDHA